MSASPLLILGGGMATGRLLDNLHQRGHRGPVRVISEEPVASYNRVLLPGYLAGEHRGGDLQNHDADWYRSAGVRLTLGRRACRIDLEARRVTLDDGSTAPWERLVIATGATVPRPRLPGARLPDGADLPGVMAFRNLADADRLRTLAQPGAPVVVVGGGLLGLETAAVLARRGADVRVVHRQSALLNRQLDPAASMILRTALEAQGISFVLGATPAALLGRQRITGMVLDDGTTLAARALVFATGTRPNDALAAAAGLRCDHGVLVDRTLRCLDRPDVYALGECARVEDQCFALVAPVYRQADALAETLCATPVAFEPPTPATRLKVSGIAVFSAGRIDAGNGTESVCIADPARGIYRRLIFRGQRLEGAILLGDTTGSALLSRLIETGTAIPGAADQLAFGLSEAA